MIMTGTVTQYINKGMVWLRWQHTHIQPYIEPQNGVVAWCVWDVAEASSNESRLMQEWFNVVHEKNALVRYESELLVQ